MKQAKPKKAHPKCPSCTCTPVCTARYRFNHTDPSARCHKPLGHPDEHEALISRGDEKAIVKWGWV